MKSEFLAHPLVLRGAVVVTGPSFGRLELPRLYARWVDAGDGTILLRGCHASGEISLTTHGIEFGDALDAGNRISLSRGSLGLRIEGAPEMTLEEGTMAVLDTDGWTFIRFQSIGTFGGKEKPVEVALDGWYSDLSY